MWNEPAQAAQYVGSTGGSVSMPIQDRRTRSGELHDALQMVEKNAEGLRLLAGEIAERLLGPTPSAIDKTPDGHARRG